LTAAFAAAFAAAAFVSLYKGSTYTLVVSAADPHSPALDARSGSNATQYTESETTVGGVGVGVGGGVDADVVPGGSAAVGPGYSLGSTGS
jgi:hypothetical protein